MSNLLEMQVAKFISIPATFVLPTNLKWWPFLHSRLCHNKIPFFSMLISIDRNRYIPALANVVEHAANIIIMAVNDKYLCKYSTVP